MSKKILFRIKTIAFAIVFSLFIAGCGSEMPEISDIPDISDISDVTPAKNIVETTKAELQINNDTDANTSDNPISVPLDELTIYSPQQILQAKAFQSGRYAYETLNEEDKDIYINMYLAIYEMSPGIKLECYDSDKMKHIFQCMMMDHPELFWANGYTYVKYTSGNELVAIGFTGIFTIDNAERQRRQGIIDAYVSECFAGLPQGDDYQKIKYIYEYIILHTEYDLDASDNQNISSVFVNNRSVCQGYAKATQYLLNLAGIKSTLVIGTTVDNESHAWNLVMSNGCYYYVDTTWGDASYRQDTGYTPSINYDYLCVPSYELSATHTIESVVPMPSCSSIIDNYYVREGAYFTFVNEVQLKNVFDNAIAAGAECATVKCSDMQIYYAMKQYLLDEQHIFDYVSARDGGIVYIDNEAQRSITFEL